MSWKASAIILNPIARIVVMSGRKYPEAQISFEGDQILHASQTQCVRYIGAYFVFHFFSFYIFTSRSHTRFSCG